VTSVCLPVGKYEVALRPPTGLEDLLLCEAPALDAALAVALADCLGEAAGGRRLGAAGLCITDLDTLLLSLRRVLLGDLVRGDTHCPAEGCRQRIDVSFRTGDYLAHCQPEPAADAEPEGDGWYRLRGTPVHFRLPTAADVIAAGRVADPEGALARLCVTPEGLTDEALRRAQEALEQLAPSLSQDLSARCPECGAAVTVAFDARSFCLRELRDGAASLFEDVALLAGHFHWSEADILALPRARRLRYAELARRGSE
jgi:hypothetical protein